MNIVKDKTYFPELDGLRFFAFLAVFVHHSPVLWNTPFWITFHDYGWMGVDLFLCLSAYLITKLLLVEYQTTGAINVKNFYIRRTLRIWPLYFLFLGIVFVFVIHDQGWSKTLLLRTLGMMTFTDNIFTVFLSYNVIFYFSAHLWTISYEEQFYAVIPWALKGLFKIKDKAKILIVFSFFLIFMLVRAAMIYFKSTTVTIWVLPISHFESILGGLIVGLGMFDDYLKKIPGWLLMALGFGALAVIFQMPNGNVLGWGLLPLYSLVGLSTSLILYSVILEKEWIIKSFLRNKFLTYFGKISYGLYVYHVFGLAQGTQMAFALKGFSEKLAASPLSVFGIGLCLTLLIATVSYQWVEKPFLRLKKRFTAVQSRPI